MSEDGNKNYTKPFVFYMTAEQKRFLQMYAEKTSRSNATILRNFVSHLMEKHKWLAKEAEKAVREGW
jgi:predicted DNA-binding protein